MSINAIVSAVHYGENGVHELCLEGAERGQPILNFRDPSPDDVGSLIGQRIWGSASTIMLGETKIADRTAYTLIVFCVDHITPIIRENERG